MSAWLSPPNLLTYLRIVLTPVVAIAILQGRHRSALALVVFAGLTDGADGFLARHFAWQTRIGGYLDPIADKLMLVVVYGALTAAGYAPVWLFLLILLRDVWILAMVGFAWRATPIRDFPPRIAGKLSTAAQIALAATLLIRNAFSGLVPGTLVNLFSFLVVAMAIASGVDYTLVALRRYRAWRNSSTSASAGLPTN